MFLKLKNLLFFTKAICFFVWFIKMLNYSLHLAIIIWTFKIAYTFFMANWRVWARQGKGSKLSSSMTIWPLSVIAPNTLDEIFYSSNIDDKTCWIATVVCSLGIPRVCKHIEFRTNFSDSESTKWTVSEIYERCWWLEVHRFVVIVQ